MSQKTKSLRKRGDAAARDAREQKSADPRQLSLLDAEELARSIVARIHAPQGNGQTFGEACDAWLKTVGRLRLDTRNENRHVHHLRELAPLRERELTPGRVRDALMRLMTPDGTLSASTVNGLLSKGRRIIREAQLQGTWTSASPFDMVPRFKEDEPEHHRITLAEVRRWLPKLRRDRWREAVFAILLGPRPGELKALRKEDIDMEARCLTIRRSNGRDRTKTGKRRVVPIPDELLPVLKEAMEASPSELVFPNKRGERQSADSKMAYILQTAYAMAGIVTEWLAICRRSGCGVRLPMKKRVDGRCPECGFKLWLRGIAPDVRWYDLRHAASNLHQEAGANPLVVRSVLGHAAKSTTESIYTRFALEFQRAELNKLKLFGSEG